MRSPATIVILILLFAFSGCASMDKRKKCIVTGAVVGAAIGAGSGAAIGHQGDTDNTTEGSLIGAAVGGIIGGTIGCFYCKAEGDADGDGVPDDADKCPGTPSGLRVDSNGCPLDSDGDGIYDYLDKCPDTPKGATVDERGCWAFTGEVFFDFGKWDIKSEAHPLLKEAVNILEQNPEMRVEIQGHTDSKGPEAYNQMISEKRAMAVKAYLVKQGIDSGRLEVKGYGESDPIASNDTEEGRQKNRRVRFKRLNR